MSKKLKMYIYGAGYEYNRVKSYLNCYQDKIQIIGIVTSEKQDYTFLDGFPCITISQMDIEEMDYIIIAVQAWKEVFSCLRRYGVNDNKIIRSHVFQLPYFDLNSYLELKEKNVSIISNICLGGIIYQELGLKAISPTVNATCRDSDCLLFLENIKRYLSVDMKEYKPAYGTYVDNNLYKRLFYPMGIIDDEIVWIFPHSNCYQEIIDKWNEKRKLINWDNLAIIACLVSDEDAYRFEKLKIKKKIGFYYKDLGLSNVVCCKEWDNLNWREKFNYNWTFFVNGYMSTYWNHVGVGKIDWIKFLNGDENYLRF